MFTRRTLTFVTVMLVLAGALAGIYVRLQALQAEDESTPAKSAAANGEPALQATAFGTGVAIPVSGAEVVRDTLVVSVSATGQAQANARALLAAEVEGAITEVRVREGEAVDAGQVIARIDPERYAFELERARARLEGAQAAYAELTLFDEEIADPELRRERGRMARAKAGLGEAEVAVREAELNVRRATVRAPFAGYAANLGVVPGERVVARDSIAEVVDISQVKIEVGALESEVPYLEVGREASVSLSAFPNRHLAGRVSSINPVIDPRSRTARVTVTVPNPDGSVKPGMYARVSIAARLFADRVMVPREAILERDDRTLVFVLEPDEPGGELGTAKWVYVTTGLENDRWTEIVPGDGRTLLEPGQTVLTEGHYTLVHDARVRLVPAAES